MWMGGTCLDYGRVLLTALYELIISELCVLVSVHISKNLVHTLGRLGQTESERGKGREETFSGVSSSAGSLTI